MGQDPHRRKHTCLERSPVSTHVRLLRVVAADDVTDESVARKHVD